MFIKYHQIIILGTIEIEVPFIGLELAVMYMISATLGVAKSSATPIR